MSLDQILIDGDIFLEKSVVFELLKNIDKDIIVSMYEPKERIFKPEAIQKIFKLCNITN